jgi:hypothetical protein
VRLEVERLVARWRRESAVVARSHAADPRNVLGSGEVAVVLSVAGVELARNASNVVGTSTNVCLSKTT